MLGAYPTSWPDIAVWRRRCRMAPKPMARWPTSPGRTVGQDPSTTATLYAGRHEDKDHLRDIRPQPRKIILPTWSGIGGNTCPTPPVTPTSMSISRSAPVIDQFLRITSGCWISAKGLLRLPPAGGHEGHQARCQRRRSPNPIWCCPGSPHSKWGIPQLSGQPAHAQSCSGRPHFWIAGMTPTWACR